MIKIKTRTTFAIAIFTIANTFALWPENNLEVQKESITRIVKVVYNTGFTIFIRDLVGEDSRMDRLEVRLWNDQLGYSLPIAIVNDVDGDGIWDTAYHARSTSGSYRYLWRNSATLQSTPSNLIGAKITDTVSSQLLSLAFLDQTLLPPKPAQTSGNS